MQGFATHPDFRNDFTRPIVALLGIADPDYSVLAEFAITATTVLTCMWFVNMMFELMFPKSGKKDAPEMEPSEDKLPATNDAFEAFLKATRLEIELTNAEDAVAAEAIVPEVESVVNDTEVAEKQPAVAVAVAVDTVPETVTSEIEQSQQSENATEVAAVVEKEVTIVDSSSDIVDNKENFSYNENDLEFDPEISFKITENQTDASKPTPRRSRKSIVDPLTPRRMSNRVRHPPTVYGRNDMLLIK